MTQHLLSLVALFGAPLAPPAVDAVAPDERAPEETAPEETAADRQALEQRAPEETASDRRAPEQRAEEPAADQRAPEEAPPSSNGATEAAPRAPTRKAAVQPLFEVSGLFGLVAAGSTGGFTFGGPRIGLTAGHFSAGLSFYPSLVYSQRWAEDRVRPNLGLGPELSWHGVALFFPTYYIEHRYVPTIGLGYRFHVSARP